MTHATYEQIFEDIARAHVDIQHTDDECHFAVVSIGEGIFRNVIDLSEYKDGKRSKIHTPFLLLITRNIEFSDNFGGRRGEDDICRFVIADKWDRNQGFSARKDIWDKTERIGKEIMGYLYEKYGKRRPKTQGYDFWLRFNESSANNIGRFDDNFLGTRFTVKLDHGINNEIKWQPAKFGE